MAGSVVRNPIEGLHRGDSPQIINARKQIRRNRSISVRIDESERIIDDVGIEIEPLRRKHAIWSCKHFVSTDEPSQPACVIARTEVIKTRLCIAFFAGE